jgi:hypothetical protein
LESKSFCAAKQRYGDVPRGMFGGVFSGDHHDADPQTPLSRSGAPPLGNLPQADQGGPCLPPCPSGARNRRGAPPPHRVRLAPLALGCAAPRGPSRRQPGRPRRGFAAYVLAPEGTGERPAWVLGLWVDPAARRHGPGVTPCSRHVGPGARRRCPQPPRHGHEHISHRPLRAARLPGHGCEQGAPAHTVCPREPYDVCAAWSGRSVTRERDRVLQQAEAPPPHQPVPAVPALRTPCALWPPLWHREVQEEQGRARRCGELDRSRRRCRPVWRGAHQARDA